MGLNGYEINCLHSFYDSGLLFQKYNCFLSDSEIIRKFRFWSLHNCRNDIPDSYITVYFSLMFREKHITIGGIKGWYGWTFY